MTFRNETFLWMLQRASAAVLVLCVVVHLATMIYAIRGGLSAGEILGRTRGNYGWLAFYSVFVLACAVHVPIGLRAFAAPDPSFTIPITRLMGNDADGVFRWKATV